jgi:hypothetical protein
VGTRAIPGALDIRPFRAEELRGLLRGGTPPCVSIYLPTHRKHPGWKQDPVRFKALLGEAEALLANGGARDARALIEPLRALLDEPNWEYSLDGLAVFLSAGEVTAYRLPMPVPERVVVAETFHTKPLLRFLHANRRYYVLGISQNDVTLYEGSSYGAGPVELRGVPASLRDALGVAVRDRGVSPSGGGGAGAGAGPVFHGRGPGREDTKEELLPYFRAVDRGVRELLRDERAPLLLAAVGYYHPLYRDANRYPHLLHEGIEGNVERSRGDEIHAAAWPIVSRHFDAEIAEWRERYHASVRSGLATNRLEDVAAAAVTGRVRCLFAAEGVSIWGLLDRATGDVTRRPRQQDGRDADLLDDVAEEALLRGAEVFVLPQAQMPTEEPIAALLRF